MLHILRTKTAIRILYFSAKHQGYPIQIKKIDSFQPEVSTEPNN